MPLLSFKRGAYKFIMWLIALAFVIVGVAGPQFGSKLQQVKKKGVELMIALDVSNSMGQREIGPGELSLDTGAGYYTPSEFEEKYLSPDYDPASRKERYGKES